MANSKYTLQQRLERARELRAQGYVCSQCVLMAFPDVTGLSDTQAASVSIGLGGGVGGQGDVCGCVTSMAALCGCASQGNPQLKPQTYSAVRTLSEEFMAENGSMQCRALKQSGKKPCMQLIENAVEIFHQYNENKPG